MLPNVFCVDLFNFLYPEKIKSTCKHVLDPSHHLPSDDVWPFFVSQTRILQHQNTS